MVTMKTLGTNSLSSFWGWILTFFWGVCWLVVAAFVVASFFVGETTSCEFPIWLDRGPRYELTGVGGTWTVVPTSAQLRTPHTYARTAVWIAAGFLALGAYVLGLLRDVFRSLRDGSPFVAANARRFRRMGLTILVIEALRLLVTVTLIAPVIESLQRVDGRAWVVDLWPSWSLVFVACVFLILAEVFRRGTVMQDEQELTV